VCKVLLSVVLCAVMISACNLPVNFAIDSIDVTAVDQTAKAFVSQKFETPQPEPSQMPSPTARVITPTRPAVTQGAEPSTSSPSTPRLCDQAGAGNPLDVTIPDDTRLLPDEEFTKVWRLANLGTCDWSTDYAVVFFSGDDLSGVREQPFLSSVASGSTAEFAVDMTAPTAPGIYSSYWMLRNNAGELFGIGPNGNSPFWVRIQVVAVETATPTVTATLEPTSIVLATGSASLLPGQSFDLDSGEDSAENQVDTKLEQSGADTLQWKPENSARFAVFGLTQPSELECQYATLSDQPQALSAFETGVYLCYRTSKGLPGRLQIVTLPAGGTPLQMNFTTWAIP
ncbi:MAG TPA: NBR1-Ig-like domain-containing protein, partial [Bellilinea sp.]|nr:NBR1-Ig-like domain-containing protein [Bellilinea sp.]